MEKINVRNIYIELLNKIKNVQGVDKDYVDDLIELVDDEITSLDSDINAITSVIPESASVSNQLATAEDIPDVTQIELDLQTLTASVSAIDLLIPSGASSSNQLATANDIPPVKSGDLTYGLTTDYKEYNGDYDGTIAFINERVTVNTSGWSGSPDASGYYTKAVNMSSLLTLGWRPIVSIIGSTDDVKETAAQSAAYNLIDIFNFTNSGSHTVLTLKTKTIPTETFYINVQGLWFA